MSKSTNKQGGLVAALVKQGSERYPKYKPQFEMVGNGLTQVGEGLDKAWPYVVKGYGTCKQGWEKLQPYNPEQYFPLLMGLVMCFFGGSYLTIIAAVEAVRLTVWEQLEKNFTILYNNFEKASDANKKDDEVDDDNDGVPDVQQITSQELLSRKFYLFLRTVDPDQVSEALLGCWGGFLSIVATLRVHFAQAVTLGCSIGEMLWKHFHVKCEPFVEEILPADMRKWAPKVVSYGFKVVGVIVAWFLRRIITGFHSAMRGGNMAAVAGIQLAKKQGFLNADFDENSPRASALAGIIGMIGFYWQLSNGFALPFPLNILFLPITIVEWILEIAVGVSV